LDKILEEEQEWGVAWIGGEITSLFPWLAPHLKTMIASQKDLSSPQDNGAKSAICDYRSSQFGFSEWRFTYV